MSSSNDMHSMYQEVKAEEPNKQGNQYNDGLVAPLSVTRDQWGNEITEDRTYHTNTTPAEGSFNFSGNQYSEDWQGGFTAYGTNMQDMGVSPQVERMTVDNSRADRGKES